MDPIIEICNRRNLFLIEDCAQAHGNSLLDELQAAFLRIKLKYLDNINHHNRNLAKFYLQGIKNDLIFPDLDPDIFDVYHIFNFHHNKRDQLRKYLFLHVINTEIHYPIPPHKQKAMAFLKDLKLPVSEEINKTTLSYPISCFHSQDDIYKVVDILNQF